MITISEWAGLATNASPYSIPPGAAVTQVNLQAIVPGQISVRPGTSSVSFATHGVTDTAVRRMFRFPRDTDRIVYQNSAGQIIVGVTPT